jgi:predicted O-linked N-acetylglucosamine transferase (SPINDLY family)
MSQASFNTPNVARNDPCPCGSGRRFKACHGAIGASASSPQAQSQALSAVRASLAAGKHHEAEQGANAILRSDDRQWEAWLLLGLAVASRDARAAEQPLRRALELAPDKAEPAFRLADLLRRSGDADAAIPLYERALALEPGHAFVLNGLGLALQAIGRPDDALRRFEEATARAPQFMEAHANLGELWSARGDDVRAGCAFAAAIGCNDRIAQLWSRKGVSEYRAGALDDAHASFLRARDLAPGDVKVLLDLARVRTARKQYAEAHALVSEALQLDPADADAENVLLYLQQHLCEWHGLDRLFQRQRSRLETRHTALVTPHNMLALPYSLPELKEGARRWSLERIRADVPPRPHAARSSGARLRIAYCGPDFRAHPLANLLTEVIELHDRSRFEVIGYSVGPDDRSAERERFARAFDRFDDVAAESSQSIAQRIRDDGIAILLDTSGYVLQARNDVFAARPAPIQVNCIGFAGTLGAPWYDYILADRCVLPESARDYFAEAPLYLPHCYMPGDRQRRIAAAPDRAMCGLPPDAFVYCCFNASYKISAPMFALWMRVLAKVPHAVLWLLAPPTGAAENLRGAAERAGVDPRRLHFAPHVSPAEHLARHAVADLFLDTLPYNAHTTANDALFAGLPLLTCPGDTFASRVAASHLWAIDMPELVAPNIYGYESLAIELARDPARLREMRARLARNRDTHALFDTNAYTRALEALLLEAWASEAA